jgi:hypothetical protein
VTTTVQQGARTYTNAPVTTHTTTTHTTSNIPVSHVQTNNYRTTAPAQAPVQGHAERRLDEQSARILARKVFGKYDDNHSGYMNSMETAQMISDLYSSLNVDHPVVRQEGIEFMNANDANNDNSISLKDFEDVFVQHLSTGDQSGFKLFLDANTYATRFNSTGQVKANQGYTSNYNRSPQPAPVNVARRQY